MMDSVYVSCERNVKMKSRVKIVITVEFLVEFCIGLHPRSFYDDRYFSQNDDFTFLMSSLLRFREGSHVLFYTW